MDSSLLDKGLLNEEEMLEALSAATQLKPVNLNHFYPDFSLAKLLLPEWCQQNCCVPLCEEDEALHVAVGYPPKLEALEEFSLRVGRKLLPWIALECRIQQWLATLYEVAISKHTFELLEKLSQTTPTPESAPPPPAEPKTSPTQQAEELESATESSAPQVAELESAAENGDSQVEGLESATENGDSQAEELESAAEHGDSQVAELESTTENGDPQAEGLESATENGDAQVAELESATENGDPQVAKLESAAENGDPQVAELESATEHGDAQVAELESATENGDAQVEGLESAAEHGAPQVEGLSLSAASLPHHKSKLPWAPSEAIQAQLGKTSFMGSRVFKDFFVKMKQQLLPTPEKPPEDNTTFSAIDEEIPLETLFEECLANLSPSQRPQESAPPPLPPLEEKKLPHTPLPQAPNNAAPVWTLGEATEQLRRAQTNRDKLTSVLLHFGLSVFEFVGLFSVIHGKAQGFSCAGKGTVPGFLRTQINLASPGLFHSVAQTLSAYFGPPPQEPRLQRFLLDIQRKPRSIFVYPIAVGDKLVALFYGDSGLHSLQQKQFTEFTLFCQQLPAAFHELLWVRRKYTTPLAELDETAREERLSYNLKQLLEADAAAQQSALEMLEQTPEASAKALIQRFPGPPASPPHALGPIERALLYLGEAGAQALLPLLSSEDEKLRCASLQLAGAFASPLLLEPVLMALLDANPTIASTARETLPHFKTLNEWPHALRRIQHSLHFRDPLRRTLAAKAVAAAKDRGSIETLIQWTGDVDAWVAETAAWALQQLSCIQLGPSPHLWNRWWSRAQYKRRAQWLVLALESENFEQRQQAIAELSAATGESFNFMADAPEEKRLLPLQRWQQFVEQNPHFEL